MANGDQIGEWIKRGTVETTDATSTVAAAITLPTGTEGIFYVEAILHGQRSETASVAVVQGRAVAGIINGGTVTLKTPTQTYNHNPDASAYTGSLSVSGADVRVTVQGTAAHTVRWQVWMRIRLTEQAISF